MESDSKKITEMFEMIKENNQILHKLHRIQRRAHFFRIVYWLIMIGLALGAYYYIQPYLNQIVDLYNQGANGFHSLQNLQDQFSQSQWQQLVKQFGGN